MYCYLRILVNSYAHETDSRSPVPEPAFFLPGTLNLAALTFLLIRLGVMPAMGLGGAISRFTSVHALA